MTRNRTSSQLQRIRQEILLLSSLSPTRVKSEIWEEYLSEVCQVAPVHFMATSRCNNHNTRMRQYTRRCFQALKKNSSPENNSHHLRGRPHSRHFCSDLGSASDVCVFPWLASHLCRPVQFLWQPAKFCRSHKSCAVSVIAALTNVHTSLLITYEGWKIIANDHGCRIKYFKDYSVVGT